jgi:hypothetical protein
MPDMGALRAQAPRLTTRASNGNIRDVMTRDGQIREGYATIASPSRRLAGGFGSLFGNSSPFDNHIPPVPSLPSSISSAGVDRLESPTSGVVRQPRGPGVGGFTSRREQRVVASESALRGLDARSHEPLEM